MSMATKESVSMLAGRTATAESSRLKQTIQDEMDLSYSIPEEFLRSPTNSTR